jgi:SAM-dependent methyltransferase
VTEPRPTPRARDYERTNREFWDGDADAYQAAHDAQLSGPEPGWGTYQIPEAKLRVLDDVRDRDVLEYGCGGAQWSIHLARRGARVVGLDQSRGQLRHALRARVGAGVDVQVVCASAVAVPLRGASFDVVFCDHGAMSFCDPYETVPEVARLLRRGGQLAFSISSLLRNTCFPLDDPDAAVSRRLHQPWFRGRDFDWGDGTIDFQMLTGAWIRLFRQHGFEVEDLIELRAPKHGTTTYTDYVDRKWARRWPAEEIWKVRKRG